MLMAVSWMDITDFDRSKFCWFVSIEMPTDGSTVGITWDL